MSTIFAALNNTLLAGSGILRKYDTSTKRWSIKTSVTRAERDAIEGKHVGLRIVNTTSGQIEYWTGGNWADGAASSGTLTVAPASTTITGVRVGNPVTATQTASGGTAPYTWAVVSGSLPPGYALSTGGSWSGTVSLAGTFTATIRATDASGRTGQATYTWVITAADSAALTLVVSPPSQIIENVPTGQIVAGTQITTGGTAPYVWTVSAGSIPPGYALSTAGVWSGTVTTPGTYTATVRVTDDVGAIGEATYTWVIVGVVVDGPLLIGTSSVSFYVGTPSTAILTAEGGTAPYSWSVTDGTLPDGIAVHPYTGTLMGTPTTAGAFDFEITVTDADEVTATKSYSGTVGAPSTLAVLPAITNLASAVGSQVYAYGLSAEGGTPPYTWDISAGALPTGYFLHAVNGVIYSGSDTPANATYSFTARATDSLGATGTQAYQIIVQAAPSFTDRTAIGEISKAADIIWDGAQFVTVGTNVSVAGVATIDWDGIVLTSADGITWAATPMGTGPSSWSGIAYNGSNLYVAVHRGFGGAWNPGSGSDGYKLVATSPDGVTWTLRTTDSYRGGWIDVAYGAGVFVAVATQFWGYTDGIMSSTDGITWTSRYAGGSWRRVIYAGGQFVASGDNGLIATSSNGTSWTIRSSGLTGYGGGLAYGNSRYVVFSHYSGATAASSSDGITWSPITLPGGAVPNDSNVAYGGGLFVAVGTAGEREIFSTDGTVWAMCSVPAAAVGSRGTRNIVAYGNSTFAALGTDAYAGGSVGALLTSP